MDLTEEKPSGGEKGCSLALHRVRFVDWSPSAITSLAFLPCEEEGASSSRSLLAVGYENGNINLCVWVQDDCMPSSSQTMQTATAVLPKGWLVDTTLVGAIPSKVDTLAFVLSASENAAPRKARLFSTSGGSLIIEHFLPPHLLQKVQARSNTSFSSVASQSFAKHANSIAGTSRSIPSQGGSVWCMEASPLGRYLAVGCEDGHVRIIDIRDNRFEVLAHSRSARRTGSGSVEGIVNTLDRAKTRIVSLAWGPPRFREGMQKSTTTAAQESDSDSDDDDEGWEESFLLGGTTHSSALVWSLSTGRVDRKLLVDKSRNEQTIVWAVAVLQDGTLVMGDSLGHVSFFEAKSHTLLTGGRFTSHGKGADVLTICIGSDGETVYSAGLDQKVIEYARVGKGNDGERWICTGTRRLHAHDIRALAIDPPFAHQTTKKNISRINRLPVLISGGTDCNLVVIPASPPSQMIRINVSNKKKSNQDKAMAKRHAIVEFDDSNPISTSPYTNFADTIQRRVSFVTLTGRSSALSGGGVIRICPGRRWVMLRRERSVGLWALPETVPDPHKASDLTDAEMGSSKWTKLLEMQVKLQSNIVCAEIASNGRFIAVADLYETKLFELVQDGSDLIPKKVKSFRTAFQDRALQSCPGSSAITFTPDVSRIILASNPSAFIHVVELPRNKKWGECKLLKSFDQHRKHGLGRAVAGRGHDNGRSYNGNAMNGLNGTSHYQGKGSDAEEASSEEEDAFDVDERTAFSRIDILQTSPDGQYLVSTDTSRRIHSFSLDTLHYHRALPSTSQVPTSLSFDLSEPSKLCILLPTNQIVLYDLEGRNSDIQTKQFRSMENALMERIITVRESAIGAIWLSSTQMIIWGSTWICTAKLAASEESRSISFTSSKRGRENGPSIPMLEKQWNISLTFKYQPLLHVGLLNSASGPSSDDGELVVVERPYYDIARSLPPTWFSGSTYGT